MILGVYEDLEKWSDKLRNYVVQHDDPFTMVAVFLGILFVFIIGYNMLHKGE